MNQLNAKLRVCASCEWIFKEKRDPETGGCPRCGFAHYGARHVYGDKAYTYAKTQRPWFNRKIADYSADLLQEIEKFNESKNETIYTDLAIEEFKTRLGVI